MGKEYYFKTDDRLKRKRYAEFLKSMLENCDHYRREDSDGAYVIAIDSPWGTGKTRFAKMLRNHLEDRTKEMGDNSLPGKDAAFCAIYYNSWETDFSDDALLPLIHSLVKSPEFELKRFEDESKEFVEDFKKTAISVAKVAGYAILHNTLGETATQMVKAVEDSVSKKKTDPLEDYQKRLDILDEFRKSLEKVIEQTKQKKLVIIVDELDRCRPTFAIQTLELAKHLFAVKGLIFIFALDIKQLSCSVRTVYGNEMDAPGYLCRFFDYISRLPQPDKTSFIKGFFEALPFINGQASRQDSFSFITSVAEVFDLSLRDISTILQIFSAIDAVILYKYNYFEAKMLYIILMVIKYKDIQEYSDYLCGNSNNKYQSIIKKLDIPSKQKDILISQLDEIKKHNRIRLSFMKIINLKGEIQDTDLIQINNVSKGEHKGKPVMLVEYQTKMSPGLHKDIFNLSDTWGYLLFYADLENWATINNLTFSEFFFRQLEMFDFVFPKKRN